MDFEKASLNHSLEEGHCVIPQTLATNDRETELPCAGFENFDLTLPPTPDTSSNSVSENGETLNDLIESILPSDVSDLANILTTCIRADSDLVKSLSCENTLIGEVDIRTVPNNLQVLKFPSKQIQEQEKHVSFEKENDQVNNENTDGKFAELGLRKEPNMPKKLHGNMSRDRLSRASGLTQFPPCVICCGKSSGSHYGAITCEACKGFFRRYLQKKTDFKCTKGGNCAIISSKKGICSGCRLKKCLDLGMSKEKTKMGRYTLTKRTEAIINLKMHQEEKFGDTSQMRTNEVTNENTMEPDSLIEGNSLLMNHLMKGPKSLNLSGGFNELLVTELVQCFNVFEPYGPNIKTKEQIAQTHKNVSEQYKKKVEMFGNMKAISREEYNEIYSQWGIDIDGRMADMKLNSEIIDYDMSSVCNFAKHIPEFHNFPMKDKVSLLNSLMIDFFTIVYLDCYNEEYHTFIYKNGQGYHFEEIAGRDLSEKLVTLSTSVYCRLQMLNLNTEERALLAALTVVSPDRCRLENRALVEKVQLSLTELLQTYIKKYRKAAGNGRFTKIIDSLTFMRELTDQYKVESNEMCKDEVLQKEFPQIKEFFVEENY